MAGHRERKGFHYSGLCTWHSTHIGPKLGVSAQLSPGAPLSLLVPPRWAPLPQAKLLHQHKWRHCLTLLTSRWLQNSPGTGDFWAQTHTTPAKSGLTPGLQPHLGTEKHGQWAAVSSSAVYLEGGVLLYGLLMLRTRHAPLRHAWPEWQLWPNHPDLPWSMGK